MRRLLAVLMVGAICICALFVSPAFGVTLIALEYDSDSLYYVDTDDIGNPVLIGSFGSVSDPTALATKSATQVYMTDRTSNALLTVNTSDASIVDSVTLDRDLPTHPRGFDIVSVTGTIFGVFENLELAIIDPLTGATTYVSTITDATVIEGVAFAPDGTLYAVGSPTRTTGSETLYTVNIATGQLTTVGTLLDGGSPIIDIDNLVFAPDGYLYGADSINGVEADLFRIDPNTAGLTNLGNTGVTGLNGIAAAVPIPAAVWLFGSALCLLGWVRRRASS